MLYFFLLIILTLLYMRFETRLLRVNSIYFTKNTDCLKIAHLSDIHINRMYVSIERINKALKKQKPDLIIITGDLIEESKHVDKFLMFLKSIRQNSRVLLCLGNHDHRAFQDDEEGLVRFIEAIEKVGGEVLRNKAVSIKKKSMVYNLIGLEDYSCSKLCMDEAFKTLDKSAFINIAFSHNPDIALKLNGRIIDYLFCGHFHGGQIWMPFDLEFRILRKDNLCKMGIKRGLHRINGITMYINRGIGNVFVPFRFMSCPEISVYHIPTN